jgi:hypothetical protein
MSGDVLVNHTRPYWRRTAAIPLMAATALLFAPNPSRAELPTKAAVASVESTDVNTQSKETLQRWGSKVIVLSRKKVKGQEVRSRIQPGGYRTLSILKYVKPAEHGTGKGTYALSATFKGYSGKLRSKNLVQVGASQNAGAGGSFAGLDIRKCDSDGYAIQAEYQNPGDESSQTLSAYTKPLVGEQGISRGELATIGQQFGLVFRGFSESLPIDGLLMPAFEASPTTSIPREC